MSPPPVSLDLGPSPLIPADGTRPVVPAGELHIRRPVPPASTRPGRAIVALQIGPDGFLHGEPPITRIVVGHDPTFDDMLAALIVEEKQAEPDRVWPSDLPLVHYAAALAGGFHPAEGLKPEDTLDGIFAVIHQGVGDPHPTPAQVATFLTGWQKLAAVLRPVLADPRFNPWQQSLVADRHEFLTERLTLQSDRKVYERDVRNGERAMFHLPGDKDPVAGLRLDRPKSSLFKFWARSDPNAPGGDGYHFLAVKFSAGDWFFSTDPRRQYDIRSLAEALQKAEVANNPARLGPDGHDPDPWYDGGRHGFTIVRPPRDRTKLKDDKIGAIVRAWGRAKPVPEPTAQAAAAPAPTPPPPRRRIGTGVAVAVGLALVLGAGLYWWNRPRPIPDPTEAFAKSGVAEIRSRNWFLSRDEATLTLNDLPANTPVQVWLVYAGDGPPPEGIRVRLPGGKTEPVQWKPKAAPNGGEPADPVRQTNKIRVPPESQPQVTLELPNPTAEYALSIAWRPSPYEVHLHATAVGVSAYNPDAKVKQLRCGSRDAEDLMAAFAKLEGGALFDQVKILAPLTDDLRRTAPLAANILNHLKKFKDQVAADKATRLKLAVVAFSGHGIIHDGRHYVFLPRNFCRDEEGTHVYWDIFMRYLGDLGCPTLLILDTCHSGQAVEQFALDGSKGPEDNEAIRQAIDRFGGQRPGLFILAGADKDGSAWEPKDGQNSFLSGAVLEMLDGRGGGEEKEVITLADLADYAEKVVPERAPKDKQGNPLGQAQMAFPRGAQPKAIPIAYRPKPPPQKPK